MGSPLSGTTETLVQSTRILCRRRAHSAGEVGHSDCCHKAPTPARSKTGSVVVTNHHAGHAAVASRNMFAFARSPPRVGTTPLDAGSWTCWTVGHNIAKAVSSPRFGGPTRKNRKNRNARAFTARSRHRMCLSAGRPHVAGPRGCGRRVKDQKAPTEFFTRQPSLSHRKGRDRPSTPGRGLSLYPDS
jgi:hypothetical protein